VKIPLQSGKPVTVPFTIKILRAGEYKLPFSSLISYNRIENDRLEKTLYLVVKSDGSGNMEII
jgi:hypothetical protein